MRILVANFFPAFSPPSSGGEQRYFHLYHHLSRWHDVTLLSASYSDKPESFVQHSSSFREYRVPKPPITDPLHWELYQAGIGDECSAFVVALSCAVDSALRTRFRELLVYADVVVHESPFTFALDESAWTDGKPRVYASYNVEHRLAAQMLRGESGAAASRFIRFLEGTLVQRADLVLATCTEERDTFAADFGAAPAKIHIVPNGFEPIEEATLDIDEARAAAPMPYAVFLGSGHPPNVEAGRFICERLASAVPELEFRILGTVCSRLEGSHPPNVKLLGFVEETEMRRQLRDCTAALNPLFTGAGTNLKMLQYLAAGAPIVTTKVGARGLDLVDGVDAIVVEIGDFAARLKSLVSDAPLQMALATAGRDKAHSHYTWATIAEHYSLVLGSSLQPRLPTVRRPMLLLLNDYGVTARDGGGAVRIFELARELSAEFDVELLCLGDNAEPSRARIADHAWQRSIPKTPEHRAAERLADGGQWVSVRDIVAADWVTANEAFMTAFHAMLPHASAVAFEHPFLAPLARLVPDYIPVIYSSQNVEEDLKRNLLRPRADGERWARRAAELECEIATRATAIVSVCASDARTFEARYPGKPCLVAANGVTEPPRDAAKTKADATGAGTPWAVFVGSAHPPNIEAATFILERVAPEVPEIEFHFIGSVGNAIAHLPRPANVVCHGIVTEQDKNQLLRRSLIAVNPMFSGGGSSLKVPDLLAAGLPLVSTKAGARGFDLRPDRDFVEATGEDFAAKLRALAADAPRRMRIARAGRRAIRGILWDAVGARYRRYLRRLLRTRPAATSPRILVATYRLMDPAPGGAESYLNNLLARLGVNRGVTIDVACCDVGSIHDQWQFSARYGTAAVSTVPPPGVNRVHRFPIDPPAPDVFEKCRRLYAMWMDESVAQWKRIGDLVAAPVLLGGWNHPEGPPHATWRWSGLRAQFLVPEGCDSVRIEAEAPGERLVTLHSENGVLCERRVEGQFELESDLHGRPLVLELRVDLALLSGDDPRQLGACVRRVAIRRAGAWEDLDLRTDAEQYLRRHDDEAWIDSLVDVTQTRDPGLDAMFLEVRGPHSHRMAEWLEDHVAEYDAIVVQGAPFAPIVWVPPIARARGVPVVLLPHYHVEDRYYHWQGYYRAFQEADCVLAFPDSIKPRFFDKIGAEAVLVSGGGIALEEYEPRNLARCLATFRGVHRSVRPFVLVLGRKAGGKRYSLVLEAARGEDTPFDVVMIGPDDDGLPIDQPGVHCYGSRPRDFVLGALVDCVCLVNMSESESFGIVLIEAWAAGRPVVAQRRCVAFADLVREGETGFLAETPEQIRECVMRYVSDPDLAARHGAAGREVARRFSWEALAARVYDSVVVDLAKAGSPAVRISGATPTDMAPFVQDAVATTRSQIEAGAIHDADFEAFRNMAGLRAECILDIGANRGQSLASLRFVFPEALIHSFEANPVFFPVLEQVAAMLPGRCRIHRYGLGRSDGQFTLYVPWAGGLPWLEESSTRLDYFELPWVVEKFAKRGELELQEVSAAIRCGDSLGLDPQVIKIDVEGAENEVISGLVETIRRAKPILLVENSDWNRVTQTLAELGFRPFLWEPVPGKLIPVHGHTTTNTFYLHETAHAWLFTPPGERPEPMANGALVTRRSE